MKTTIAILATVITASACAPNYSDGTRTGVVTKLSNKGLVFKSWEGEMLMALPGSAQGTAVPEKFTFNVDPPAVDAVKAAMLSGSRVELVYRQWAVSPPTIDSMYVVTGVVQEKP